MNSPSISYFSKKLLSILFIASLVLVPVVVRAQDYTEEQYKVFEDVQAEKDNAKKVDMIVTFLKENPKNGLRPSMIAEYQKAMIQLKNEKKWAQIISFGEKFLSAAPSDDFTEGYLAAAYSETNNPKGFVEFAEKLYASKPSSSLAMEIARSYQKLGNDAKYLQWRERVLASDPDNVEILADMIQKYSANQNIPQALKYSKQCLSALPNAKKPAGIEDQQWKAKLDAIYGMCYGVIGDDAYRHQRYAEAVKNLEAAVKYLKRFDNAYFDLGMCYWQTNKIEPAMLNFAKAYVIRGGIANQAKQQLDKMWRASHQNSLAGEERMIDRATQDLK